MVRLVRRARPLSKTRRLPTFGSTVGAFVMMTFFVSCVLLLAPLWRRSFLEELNILQFISRSTVSSATTSLVEPQHWATLDCSTLPTALPLEGHHELASFFATTIVRNLQMATHNPREDCPISSDIHKDGCYECHVLQPLLRVAQDDNENVTAILDIGANIGLYGLSVAALGKAAYMVEPAAINQARICASIQKNAGFADNVHVFKVAAVNEETHQAARTLSLVGTTDLNKGGIMIADSSNSEARTRSDAMTSSQQEGVDFARTLPLSVLHNQLPRAGSTIVLKVDVEGNECNALEGALPYLKTIKIAYCAIEWSQERLQKCRVRAEIFQLFVDNGLRPYQAMLNETTHPIGWEELDVNAWESWIWRAPHRKRPERALFDVAWSKRKPVLVGPIIPKISPKKERCIP